MENSLKWFDYPHARAHPGCAVSCHGTEWTCIVGSSVIRWGQPDSGESCIVPQSGLTRSLIAKFPQHSVVACSMQISCCWGRMLQMRPQTDVCEPLMPDVVSLSGPTFGFTMREFGMLGGYTTAKVDLWTTLYCILICVQAKLTLVYINWTKND